MKTIFKIFSIVALVVGLYSCSSKVALNPTYFNSPSRVGFLVVSDLDFTSSNSGGRLLGDALTPYEKYQKALQTIQSEISPANAVTDEFKNVFTKKGKTVIPIDDKIDLKEFQSSERTDEKYFRRTVSYLKSKYAIDELLIVMIKYGTYAKYSYAIETERNGKTIIDFRLLSLATNKNIYKGKVLSHVPFDKKWENPPEYAELKQAVKESTKLAIAKVGREFGL